MKIDKLVYTALLPQYQRSASIMERFLEAAHQQGAEIARAQNSRGTKKIEESELSADAFSYFVDNKSELETEFLGDLAEAIGAAQAELFCEITANDWYDGKGLRNGARVLGLKAGVREYLINLVGGVDKLRDHVEESALEDAEPLFSGEEIAKILRVNDFMLYRHLEAWKNCHPDSRELSNDDIFFRRGLALSSELDTSNPYIERDYISSYSLAITAPEKFAQMRKEGIPAIVNGDIALFESRILFFSPFVPSMEVGQLEAGVIPANVAIPISCQGRHGGILEYILGSRPPFEIWKTHSA